MSRKNGNKMVWVGIREDVFANRGWVAGDSLVVGTSRSVVLREVEVTERRWKLAVGRGEVSVKGKGGWWWRVERVEVRKVKGRVTPAGRKMG